MINTDTLRGYRYLPTFRGLPWRYVWVRVLPFLTLLLGCCPLALESSSSVPHLESSSSVPFRSPPECSSAVLVRDSRGAPP